MKRIPVENIEDNMVLGREVCGIGGNVLLVKGTILTEAIGRRLQNWDIPFVYIEGEEELAQEENTIDVSPEELRTHLEDKFKGTLKNIPMMKIFEAVYQHRLSKNGK